MYKLVAKCKFITALSIYVHNLVGTYNLVLIHNPIARHDLVAMYDLATIHRLVALSMLICDLHMAYTSLIYGLYMA